MRRTEHVGLTITRNADPMGLWVVVTPSGIRYGEKSLYAAKRRAEELACGKPVENFSTASGA